MADGLSYMTDVTEWTEDDKHALCEAIEQAKWEWYAAQLQMQQVDMPDLIDYAIYSFLAAEAKYSYLLKLAKTVDIHAPFAPAAVEQRPFWLRGRW